MRIRWYVAAALGVFAAASVVGVAKERDDDRGGQNDRQQSRLSEDELERMLRGFEIAPVRLNLRGKDLELVGLGSYIVNGQGGCNDCHTLPSYKDGRSPFLGQREKINTETYLAGGVPFGPFVSRNLTPRANGLPANLTWDQFRKTLRTGEDMKNRPPHVPSDDKDLLQVMPWPVYGKMSNRDLRAIYEYLSAIPSLPTTPTPEPAAP